MRKMKNNYDFSAIGQAIKRAREEKGWTREQTSEVVDLAPRYLLALENNGKNPSGQVLVELATLFDVSIDQYIFPNKKTEKTSRRRQLEKLLDDCDDKDLSVVTATVKALIKTKTAEEE